MACVNNDVDRISGQCLSALNEAIKKHVEGDSGFLAIDTLSEKLFPSVFGMIQNCVCKPLQKHPFYKNIELLWAGSSAEGVNIPNFERTGGGRPHLNFEMDILCVFRDFIVGSTADSPAVFMKQEDTSEGYFLVFVRDPEYRRKWSKFCISPSDAKRSSELYLNPFSIVEDMYKQVDHILKQIPEFSGLFTLEFNPPAVTLTMSTDFQHVTVSCDIVVALELPPDCVSKEYPTWTKLSGQPDWLSDESYRKVQEECYHLVGKSSPGGQEKVEWRLSFNRIELFLFKELKENFPTSILCYRMFKLIRFWHLRQPDFLHSYHLQMIFLRACHKLPSNVWSKDNFATNILGLLEELFSCLATHSLPSYFLPKCNLIAGVHPDFILTVIRNLDCIRKDPLKNIINLER